MAKGSAIIDLVKWDDASDNQLAYRHPNDSLSTWTQLIVAESQEAMLVHGGQMEGPFAAGRHTLSTENIPILRGLLGLPFGGKSPFTAEVWFVNRSIPLDVPWKFDEPLLVKDPEYGVIVPIHASGQYGVAIEHTRPFLKDFVGTKKSFDRAGLQTYLQGAVLSKAKAIVARYLSEKKVPILQLAMHLPDISEALRQALTDDITSHGLRFESFTITTVGPVESDSAVVSLRAAVDKKVARDIQGFTYQQERSLDVMETAAGNEGTSGGAMGAAMGVGMGVNVGGAIGSAMGGIANQLTPTSQKPAQDRMAVLRELAQMHKDGVLTDAEFAKEKQRVLNG
jgi:membrane protease subunit (stomatin/prohibitin family)